MKKGFTFQQLALILLSMIILIALILIVIMQKDQITEALMNLFGAGAKVTENLGNTVEEILGSAVPIILWQARKQ